LKTGREVTEQVSHLSSDLRHAMFVEVGNVITACYLVAVQANSALQNVRNQTHAVNVIWQWRIFVPEF
jgi:hypothetical protein